MITNNTQSSLKFCLFLLLLPLLAEGQVHRDYTRARQETEFHLKGGWQSYNFAGSSFNTKAGSGWSAGVGFKVPLRYKWWIQPEILYSKRKAALDYPANTATAAHTIAYSFSYVTYPILFIFKPNDLLEFQLGPQFAVLMNYRGTITSNGAAVALNASDIYRWDYAAAAGLEINMSPLAFGMRYAYGLRELAITEQARGLLGTASLSGLQLYGALVF